MSNTTAHITHRQFVTAGKANFTIQSKATGKHLTYKVLKHVTNPNLHFVSVLTGSDNESSYTYLGTVFDGNTFRHGKKSKISPDAVSAKGFDYLWKHIDAVPLDKMEFLPATKCCRCGRKLTAPTSVELAIGPECIKHM